MDSISSNETGQDLLKQLVAQVSGSHILLVQSGIKTDNLVKQMTSFNSRLNLLENNQSTRSVSSMSSLKFSPTTPGSICSEHKSYEDFKNDLTKASDDWLPSRIANFPLNEKIRLIIFYLKLFFIL